MKNNSLRSRFAAVALAVVPLATLLAAQPAAAAPRLIGLNGYDCTERPSGFEQRWQEYWAHCQQFEGVAPNQGHVERRDRGNHVDPRERERDDRFGADRRPPEIAAVTPQQGERVSDRGMTRISARYGDDRSGIDPRNVTLRVDGRDVTRRARVEGNEISYAEDLAPGRHFAELLVRDRSGNEARRAWAFEVVGRGWNRDGERRWDHDERRW